MGDIKNRNLIIVKGLLFLLLGILSSTVLLLHSPNVVVAVMLGLSIWAFCRFYYFAFYVIQQYVDPSYRFSGLVDFVKYALSRTTDDKVASQ